MKVIFFILALLAIVYGVNVYYDGALLDSLNRTVEKTSDFATDKAVKDTNINSDGSIAE